MGTASSSPWLVQGIHLRLPLLQLLQSGREEGRKGNNLSGASSRPNLHLPLALGAVSGNNRLSKRNRTPHARYPAWIKSFQTMQLQVGTIPSSSWLMQGAQLHLPFFQLLQNGRREGRKRKGNNRSRARSRLNTHLPLALGAVPGKDLPGKQIRMLRTWYLVRILDRP